MHESLHEDLEIAAGIPLKQILEVLNGTVPPKNGKLTWQDRRRILSLCAKTQKLINQICDLRLGLLGD